MSTAEQLRERYLDFADHMEPPPSSRYARALGAISADYEACLLNLAKAMTHFQRSGWKHTEELRMCEIYLRAAIASSDPTSVSLPLKRKQPSAEPSFP